jgi:hypothetical protein
MKEEQTHLTMVVSSGLFIIGRLVGGNKLLAPRVWTLIKEGAEMQLSPLPFTPAFIILQDSGFTYPIPEDAATANIYALYKQVTTPPPAMPPGTIITPNFGSGGNRMN